MRVDVLPVARMRAQAPIDVPAALAPIFTELAASPLDLTHLRVVCDWIQYRNNFRPPIDHRPILRTADPSGPIPAPGGEAGAGRAGDHRLDPSEPERRAGADPGEKPGTGPAAARRLDRAEPKPDAGAAPTADPGGEPGGGRSTAHRLDPAGVEPYARHAGVELAVDLRRCPDIDLATALKETLAEYGDPARSAAVPLEDWGPARDGCLWRFNALYWRALSAWEEASGRGYERALPGGRSDARDGEAARATIRDLFAAWDALDDAGALPEELYVVEIGVGNGGQARNWLDAFAEMDAAHGRGYLRRLHYLMGDYSPPVLDRARQAVAHHEEHVSTLVLDATRPRETLGFLSGRVFLVYLSNVYDNLPTDEVATIDGRPYLVQSRAYLPETDVRRIAAGYGLSRPELPEVVERLLRLGPDLLAEARPHSFPAAAAAVAFWRDVWAALRRAERYVPLDDTYAIGPALDGGPLRTLLDGLGDVRMHASNGAATAFADTLPLLHPRGSLVCHDLFVTDAEAYRTGFHGPGKYDGSVVNWVNGPLLRAVGERHGVDVTITPFAPRPEAKVQTLTARPR